MHNKYLASLDIKSLYTNIPVNKCIERLHNYLRKSNTTFPLPISKLIKICTLCTSHCYFKHNNTFYKQKFGLPMGSPLSGVLACIYLEFIESGPFKHIIPNTANYFRYIADILFIYPQDLGLHSITDKLNNVEPSLKFTYELEYNCTLPFLDILLIRNINKLEFKVYRKTTCKNDHIHFYSHQNNNTKRGIIIGFYLRALRICSSKYLNDEFIHIENSFLNLQYPKSFIHYAKSKALKIHNKNQSQTNVYSISDKTSSPHRYITLPNNSSSHSITNNLNKLNIKTSLPSKTIRELVHSSPQRNIFSDAGVYCIPCKDCKLKYIGETSRNLHIRLKEHKRDIRIGNSNNALFLHISQHNHNIDFNSAKMLTYINNKNLRRIFEAAAISFLSSLNTRPGFYNISPYLSKHILNSYNIFYP